jgi:5-methylcytosine-specific restriction protein A
MNIVEYYSLFPCIACNATRNGDFPVFACVRAGLQRCIGLSNLLHDMRKNKKGVFKILIKIYMCSCLLLLPMQKGVHEMPPKALKPCAYSGCPETIREGRYCDAHKTIAGWEYNQTRRSADHNKIYGRRWRKIRNLYIAKHPLCEDCLEHGIHIPADEVHHIRPITRGGTHCEDNLRSLCKSCHTKSRSVFSG